MLAALAFFSTTPLTSFLGSLPLLSQEGTIGCAAQVRFAQIISSTAPYR